MKRIYVRIIVIYIFLVLTCIETSAQIPYRPQRPSGPPPKISNQPYVQEITPETINRVREETRKTKTTRLNIVLRYKVSRHFPEILTHKGISLEKYLPLSKVQEIENLMNQGEFENAAPLLDDMYHQMDIAENIVDETKDKKSLPTGESKTIPREITINTQIQKKTLEEGNNTSDNENVRSSSKSLSSERIDSLESAIIYYKPREVSVINVKRSITEYMGAYVKWRGIVTSDKGDKYIVNIPGQTSCFIYTGRKLFKNQNITIVGQIIGIVSYTTQLGIEKDIVRLKAFYVE